MKLLTCTMLVAGMAVILAASAPRAQTTADRQAGRFPQRPFLRQNLDKLTWTATEKLNIGVCGVIHSFASRYKFVGPWMF